MESLERKTLSGLRPEGAGQKRSRQGMMELVGVFIEKSW